MLARQRWARARQHAQCGGPASPVRADEADDLASRDLKLTDATAALRRNVW